MLFKTLKHISTLALLAVILFSCNPTPTYLSGKIENSNSKNAILYLIKPKKLNELATSYLGEIIDSATIDNNGNFKFTNTPKSEGKMLLQIALNDASNVSNYLDNNPETSNYMPIIWQSGERIEVFSTFNNFQKNFKIKQPSKENNALLNLVSIKNKAHQKNIANKSWNVNRGTELLDKEHAILKYKKTLINFADSTEYIFPAMVALRWVSPEYDYERVPEFLVRQCEKWQKENSKHPYVIELCKIARPENLPILLDSQFPDFEFPLMDGHTSRLSEMLGKKLTIIDVWASWCAPCRLENRDVFVPLWDAYHKKGLEIIAYGLESDEHTWKNAVKTDGADRWHQSSDLQGDDADLFKKMRLSTIPANFILNSQGVVIAKNLHGQALIDFINEHMK